MLAKSSINRLINFLLSRVIQMATLTIVVFLALQAKTSVPIASLNKNNAALSFSINISRKEKTYSHQFFNIGYVKEDIYVDRSLIDISPEISFFFATIRLSKYPVERFGSSDEAGRYFVDSPPQNMGTLGSWTVTSKNMKHRPPFDTSYYIKKGTYLIFEVIFRDTSSPNAGKVSLNLFKAPNKINMSSRRLYFNRFEKYDLVIPPLVDRFEASANYLLTEDIIITTLKPTMHYRGISVKMGYTDPYGKTKNLFINPRYSLYNYTGYRLKRPIFLKKGTKLWIKGVYDNSFGNLLNPNPLTTVYRGWKAQDEMLRFSYQYYKKQQR